MSELQTGATEPANSPGRIITGELPTTIAPKAGTPAEAIAERGAELNELSAYKSDFDYSIYADLERRYKDRPIFGGIAYKRPFKLVNAHTACQQCLYSLEIDTYGRGCVHDCVYCYAKAELTVHGMWNNPIPVPTDINEIRKVFYTVFETTRRSRWRSILEARIPIRIGSMTDSFMFMDKKYKVTQELLKILNFYKYPYVIFTRSDLIADDTYMGLLNKDLCAIQFSLSSINEEMNKKIEPGAPSAKRRLLALQKLNQAGFWTTVRINPVFPMRPDGYFTNPEFEWDGEVPKFDYSSFAIVDAIADHGIPSFLVGFARLSSFGINSIQKATGFDLRPFFDRKNVCKSPRDFHYSDREINYYYNQYKLMAKKRGIQYTTCYIGYGESHFWGQQRNWSNKIDCCNIKGRVAAFKTDARQIPFATRMTFMSDKRLKPESDRLHEELKETQPTLGLVRNYADVANISSDTHA